MAEVGVGMVVVGDNQMAYPSWEEVAGRKDWNCMLPVEVDNDHHLDPHLDHHILDYYRDCIVVDDTVMAVVVVVVVVVVVGTGCAVAGPWRRQDVFCGP